MHIPDKSYGGTLKNRTVRVWHRHLRPISYGLALVLGADNSVCANCGETKMRREFGVVFPEGDAGFVCVRCAGYRSKDEQDGLDFAVPFNYKGQPVVCPEQGFFNKTPRTPFVKSVREFYTKYGYLTESQYVAVAALKGEKNAV